MSFSPYITLPAKLSGTLHYVLPTESPSVFPTAIIAQAKKLLAEEIGVPIEEMQEQQAVVEWEFQSYPCPNPPVTKSTFVLLIRAATAQAEKTGYGRGVVFVRKDIERHTTPMTTRYSCYLPLPKDMTRLFYASEWITDLVSGFGDFYGILKQYVERVVNHVEGWSVLEQDAQDAAIPDDAPEKPMEMENDLEVTIIVELVSQGEWGAEEILHDLAPYKYHEVVCSSHRFQIHRLGFVTYTDRQEMLLLRAVAEHRLLAYDSLDLI